MPVKFIGIQTICLLLSDGNNGRSDLAGEAWPVEPPGSI